MKKFKKVLACILSVIFVASLFCGCANTEVKNEVKTEVKSEVNEVKSEVKAEVKSEEPQVIMRTGELTTMKATNFENEPYYPTYYYDDFNSLVLALKSGKIDSIYRLPKVVAKYIENNVDGVKAVEPLFLSGTIGLCLGTLKENNETYNLLNNAIDELLNNGTIDRLNEEYLDKYLRTKEEPKPIDMPKVDGTKILKIAVTGDMPPIDFVSADGRPAGFNIVLLSEISKIANVNIELVQINSGARLTALKTNTVDAIFYTYQIKNDNEQYELYEKEDLPDEIVITKPYYISRIFEVDSIKKIDVNSAKGLPEIVKKEQDENKDIAGMLSYAGFSEEEFNNIVAYDYGYNISEKFYDDLNSMMLAMRAGQIDFISLLPKSTAEYIQARNDDVVLCESPVVSDMRYSMATLEENKEVYNILNDNLNNIIKDGTIKNIEKKYIDEFIENKNEPEPVDMPHFDNAKIIKVAVTGDLPPFDFVTSDGKPAGYNVALLSEIANRAKVNIELVTMNQGARTTALVTKNIDAIFWLSSIKYDDARNIVYDFPKGVILTDCYYEDEVYSIYIKDGAYDKKRNGNN